MLCTLVCQWVLVGHAAGACDHWTCSASRCLVFAVNLLPVMYSRPVLSWVVPFAQGHPHYNINVNCNGIIMYASVIN